MTGIEVGEYAASRYIVEPVRVTCDGVTTEADPYCIARATLRVRGETRATTVGDWIAAELLHHDDGTWEWSLWMSCSCGDMLAKLGLPRELSEYVASTITDLLFLAPSITVALDGGELDLSLVAVRE